MNQYEQSFKEEVREKKRAGNGVHSKTGKQGRVRGGVKTPADLLTGKEKKAYTQPSPVTTSNLYYDDNEIMPLQEFKQLPRNRKMLVLDAYRKRFTARELSEAWGHASPATVYHYYRSYLSSPAERESNSSSKANKSDATDVKTPNKEKPHDRNGGKCVFVMQGEYRANLLKGRFEGLARMMANDDSRYEVEVRVKEVARH